LDKDQNSQDSGHNHLSLFIEENMHPCVACAANQGSCCVKKQIVITQGDMDRISALTGHTEFCAFEFPEPEYTSQEEDPIWDIITRQPDGQRRILKMLPDGDCFFLSTTGCRLAMETRPLICRLYPYTYIAAQLTGVDPACPISQRSDESDTLEHIGMPIAEVDNWRQQLYDELSREKIELDDQD